MKKLLKLFEKVLAGFKVELSRSTGTSVRMIGNTIYPSGLHD